MLSESLLRCFWLFPDSHPRVNARLRLIAADSTVFRGQGAKCCKRCFSDKASPSSESLATSTVPPEGSTYVHLTKTLREDVSD